MNLYLDAKYVPILFTRSVYLRLLIDSRKRYRLAWASELSLISMGPFNVNDPLRTGAG